jgi:hypothetical protein
MTTISNTADHATEHLKGAASHGRATLLELSAQVKKVINGAREAEDRGVDALLDRLGLQRRQTALNPVLWFAAGAAAAGTVWFLISSTSGKKLLRRISRFVGGEAEPSSVHAKAVEQQVEQPVKIGAPTVKNGAEQEAG